MRFLLRDRQTCAYISKLVEAIRDGCVGKDARQWLLLSWLIALDKGNNKVRPIAGGTAFVKLAAIYLMDRKSIHVSRIWSAMWGLHA